MFNAELLGELIKQAQEDRSLNNFARQCKISSSTLSRIINMNNSCPPSPSTLQKIAACAHNEVTYENLMRAAGYIESNENIKASIKNKDYISLIGDEKDIVIIIIPVLIPLKKIKRN